MTSNFQEILVKLIALHFQAKQAHWNIIGRNFRDLNLQLDEIVDDAREASDTIAERMRALHATPDGRPETVVTASRLAVFPAGEQPSKNVVDLVTERLYTATRSLRYVHDEVDAEDSSTANLLHTVINQLEKQAWILSVENHTM